MLRRPVGRRRGIGLVGATVVAGGAYAAGSSAANKSQQEQMQNQQLAAQNQQIAEMQAQQAQAAMPPPPPQQAMPAAPAPAQDRIAKLKELGDLKAAGVLSEEEFEREKARVLAS